MESKNTKAICCICKQPYEGYGNNAEPFEVGRCCDRCNKEFVIPYRIGGPIELLRRAKKAYDEREL